MKKILLTSLVLSIGFLSLSNSGGRGAAANSDSTGSPLSTVNCTNCHVGGDFGIDLSLSLLDGTTAITEYVPGQDYTVQININTNVTPDLYGFQAVALTGQDNLNAGTFGEAPMRTQFSEVNNRTYLEHFDLTEDTIKISWTAPEAGSGDVRFYAAANAVNGNGSTAGDDSDVLEMPLTITEGVASGLQAISQLDIDWQVFPNPATEQVWVRLQATQEKNLQLRLLDARGTILDTQALNQLAGDISLSLKDLTNGLYFIQIYNEAGLSSKRIFKMK